MRGMPKRTIKIQRLTTTAAFPLVSIFRSRFDESGWYGYVVGQSESLVAIHQVSDRYSLDGYRVFRRADVTEMREQFPRRDLIEEALRLKDQSPCAPNGLDLSSIRAAMESAQTAYEALVIHREDGDADEVEVGTVRMATADTYVLRWLSTDARWENDDRPFRYRDVTALEFDGEYEQTLVRVAKARGNDRPVSKPIIEIDGAMFSTLEEFYTHFQDRALGGERSGGNLDAFNDVLRGGFGTPEGGFVLVWRNHELSKQRLGYAETARQLEKRLGRCHPNHHDFVRQELARALNGQGQTVFDWLVDIITEHGPGGDEAEDGIELVLR